MYSPNLKGGAALKRSAEADLLRFIAAGSVDDGKSTLIGRLLYEASGIYGDQLDAVCNDSKRLKREGLDLSLVMDGLQAEREQAITIDVAYRYFSTPKRHFIIADTPGHEQYTRNMVTGASTSDLAVVLIDARKGVMLQSKRHVFIASLLGIKHMILAVNKMDLVGYSEETFRAICREFGDFIGKLRIADLVNIPISALKGDNVVERSGNMPWYSGPALLSHLEDVHILSDRNLIDLRFPVQQVLRPDMNFRGYSGRIASGTIHKGDEIMVLPSQYKSKVKAIVTFDGDSQYAFASQSILITLEDEIDITRGDMLVHPANLPGIRREIDAILVWMDQDPLRAGKVYLVKHTTKLLKGAISRLHFQIDPETLNRKAASELQLNEIGRASIELFNPIFCDEYTKNRQTGGFILIDPATHATVAAGMIIERGRLPSMVKPGEQNAVKSAFIHRHEGDISIKDRERLLKQRPVTVWLTGLSGSGKSSIAFELEKKLMAEEHVCVVLDGDNIRSGLNRDLGFSPQDRSENIRRVAEVARLFNEAGIIVITAFVSPYREDRQQAGNIIGKERFVEVFTDAPIEICERRDPKRLYEKARAGLIQEFTGVSAPYEAPEMPGIHLMTGEDSVEVSSNKILQYLKVNKFFDRR